VTCLEKDGNLFFPRGPVQRITMDQDNGLAGSVVLIVEVDIAGVLFANAYIGHSSSPNICPH
jgi:hypothetical protein